MKGKTTAAEKALRIAEVQEYVLQLYSTAQIVVLCKKWNVSNTTIDNYIRDAKLNILADTKANTEDTRAVILSNLGILFRKAKDDPKEQHRILLSYAKISGLDKIVLDHNIKDNRVMKDLSVDELKSLLKIEEGNEEDK